MRLSVLFFLLFSLCELLHDASCQTLQLVANSLRTEGLSTPAGVHTVTPLLSWRLELTHPDPSIRGSQQSAYEIIATDYSSGNGRWKTGKVASNISHAIYTGDSLSSRDIVAWSVRVWDEHDVPSAFSPVTTFELGLLNTDNNDWQAKWITNPKFQSGVTSLPLFAKNFTVSCPVTRARLYIAGLGLHHATLNGQDTTNEVLAPGNTKWDTLVEYSTHNITLLLGSGPNVLGVALGKGVYDAETPTNGRYAKFTQTPVPLILLAQLEYTCADGTLVVIGTDPSWQSTLSGPQLDSSWWGGEAYDARNEIPNWDSPSGDRSAWAQASVTSPPGPSVALVGCSAPPLQIMQTLTAVSVKSFPNNIYVYDLGLNFAGWPQLTMTGPAGTVVTLRPGELLDPSSGMVTQSSTGSPIFDTYTLATRNTSQTWHPRFMYHGFRYLQVEGLATPPPLANVKGLIIRTANDAVGTFQNTDMPLLTRIYTNIDRAIQSNMLSILTDCPHREKLGWMEQNHLVFPSVMYTYDIEAYARNIISKIANAQTSDGLVPDIAPEYVVFTGGFRDDPNWGSAIIHMTYQHYIAYGKTDILTQFYPNMVGYLAYLTTKASDYLLNYGLGDWATLDSSTPVGVTATFGYYRAASVLAKIATVLGNDGDAAKFAGLAQNISSSFRATYSQGNTYASGSQAADAIALDIGAVPSQNVSAVLAHLIASIRAKDNHVTVGEVTLPSLIRVLSLYGRDDVVFDIVAQTTAPSYGYQVLSGATSLTESWWGADQPTWSQNHFMFGVATEWFASSLVGIQQGPLSTGWDRVVIRPTLPTGNLTQADGSYRSLHGWVVASWTRSVTSFQLLVTIPVGSLADVYVWTAPGRKVTEGGAPLAVGNGIMGIDNTNTNPTIVYVGPGTYKFIAQ